MKTSRARWWSPRRAESARPPTRRTDDRGFSLVEALIAATVLTVALVALADLLAVSIRMHQLGRMSTTATRLAEDKFEELMKVNFATNPEIQLSAVDTLASNVANYFDVPSNSGYTRRWKVEAGPTLQMRTVTVRLIPDNPDRRVGEPFTLTAILRSW